MGAIRLWKEEYKIGHEEVDSQHRELFEKIERLLNIALTADEEVNKRECLDTVDFLAAYTVHHFETEEALQRQLNYISYPEHVKLHEQFKNTVLAYKKKVEEDFSKETLKKFVGTLMTWLTMHVCGCDKKIIQNQPLDEHITFEGADDLIRKVTVQLLADTYGIGIKSSKTSVYNGYIEGDVIVRILFSGDKNHVFLCGFSEDMARALYGKISGMEIQDIGHPDAIESSALIEIADMLSSHALAFINRSEHTQFDWKGDIFLHEYADSCIDIANSVRLEFETECGRLEILYSLVE